MSKDVFSTLRVYLSKLTEGEHTPAEVVASMNTWLRESGEAIKLKVEEEVEQAVSKMGFVKQEEFDKLKAEFESLRESGPELKKNLKKKVKAEKKTVEKKAKAVKRAVKKSVEKKVKAESKAVEKKVKSVNRKVEKKAEAVKKSAAKGKK